MFTKQAGIVTKREADVLALVVLGETDKGIGARLGLSHHTVAAHLRSAFVKLDVPNRTAAAMAYLRAREAGLL